MIIRPAAESDRDAIWEIFHAVVAQGDTYAIDPAIEREEALSYWFGGAGSHVFVLEEEKRVLGTYVLKPNRAGPGSHVANGSYMVAPSARGKGIGRTMGEHSLGEAARLGFHAMQFNFVVSTNQAAVRLWQSLGFEIVGTLPGAFLHPEQSYVDAYVMFRKLESKVDRDLRARFRCG